MQESSTKRKKPRNRNAVYTNKTDLLLYLNLLDTHPQIQRFLHYDSSFRLADKYLIAMVFIYFKRAQFSKQDFTCINFFAGLFQLIGKPYPHRFILFLLIGFVSINKRCLAHSMEEDLELSSEIYPWALGNKVKDLLPKLLELKVLLWEAMDYRAAISCYCCKQLISISENHPIWQRERKPLQFIHVPLNLSPNSDESTEKNILKKYPRHAK